MIRTVKECIWRGLTKTPDTFWSDHVTSALVMLRLTASRMTGFSPFTMVTGRSPLLPSMSLPPAEELPEEPTPEQEEQYLSSVCIAAERLRAVGLQRL